MQRYLSTALFLRCRSFLVLILQAVLVGGSLVAAWLLRFEFHLPAAALLWSCVPVLIAIRLILMPLFGLMHGWWRHTGISDAVSIAKFVLAGSCIFTVLVRYGWGVTAFPVSVYALRRCSPSRC